MIYTLALGSLLEEKLAGPTTWDHPGCAGGHGVGDAGNSRARVPLPKTLLSCLGKWVLNRQAGAEREVEILVRVDSEQGAVPKAEMVQGPLEEET